MARADSLPDDALDVIAIKAATLLAQLAIAHQANSFPELAECFAIWHLDPSAVHHPEKNFATLVIPTHRWHHQIRILGKPAAFARSTRNGTSPADWDITQLFESPIPAKIDQAIAWIDAHVIGDPLVRLLLAPAYLLYAFWLTDDQGDRIYVIDVPSNFTDVHIGAFTSARKFLKQLAREGPVVGFRSR